MPWGAGLARHEFSLSGAEDGQYAPPTPRGLRGGFNPLALGSSVAEVAVFCPNCGTQNPDTALTCSKCNFNLKGAAAPKFKGTMMMQATPPSGAPGAPPPPPLAGPASAPLPPRPAGGPPSKLKGTMVGVAPPMAGSAPKPPEAPPQPPAPPPGQPATQVMGAFAPPPRPPSAPPPAPPAPEPQFAAHHCSDLS